MKLKPNTPIIVAPAPITFDHYWLTDFSIRASNPNKPVEVAGTLRPAADIDGKKVLGDQRINVRIDNVFARIAADPTGKIAIAMGALLGAIADEAGLTLE